MVKLEQLEEMIQARPDRSLSVPEVAERLKKSVRWVYKYRAQLPFAREFVGSWFYSEQGLERFLRNGR